ncbi:MAG: nicotinamide mononucleotide transporter [Candidatus Marinimicrobia bacterium]|nr:nicotinamide mononucleotide transporter [Candidatus Neomarinimicrobiota bacterium]MBL7010128.1 nicotinamide mononucleotide transporter [Candidatus Neomarinimicrobiota bacterium]MBL7030393.1 nicotinamide mononucleotide transporter [Candidatus Neomarinimicrobiota bacterium]
MNYIEWLGWVATALLLIGYYLNAKKHLYSWLVWLLGNSIMMIYAILIQSYSVAFLSIVLVFLNIFGFITWRKQSSNF